MQKRISVLTLVLAAALAAGSTAYTQSRAPSPQSRAPKAEAEPAIGGYCTVAYVAMNQAVKGDARHASEHKGKTYLFSNADAKTMFEAEPEKYLPAYDGYCATAAAQGIKMESDPKQFTVHNGRTYLFSTAEAKAMFDGDKAGTIAKADANWPRLAKQTN